MKSYIMFFAMLAVLILPAIADIPEVLPDPDTTPPDTTKPVKVFILSGQSNMVGAGTVAGAGPETLETITAAGMFPWLIDASNNWTIRNDVMYRGLITATGNDFLQPGFGAPNGIGNNIGPELGFGHVMGYYYDEPVIVIKSSQGNRALGWDFLPPGPTSVQYDSADGYTRPGYGGSPEKWLTGTTPVPIGWYAGKQYDDCFLDEADWAPAGATQPSTFNVTDVLDNFASEYPDYAAQGFEIVGYGWWQGHRDGYTQAHIDRYEMNMVQFIKHLRGYYENRYPDNTKKDAPFVIATVAFGGEDMAENYLGICNAQLAVSGETGNYPAFEGNVKTVDARPFYRGGGAHYGNNAETYMLVGDAMGRAIAELMPPYSVSAGKDMITWSGQAINLDATVQEDITVTSYSWTAIPDDGVVFSDPAIEDPTVTITKPSGDMSRIIIKLKVNDGVNKPVIDTIRVDVYDDACKATRLGLGVINKMDLHADCIINLADLSVMANKWLEDKALTEPVIKVE